MMRYFSCFLLTAFFLLSAASTFGRSDQKPMTNSDVVKMVESGMSEAAIINAIKAAKTAFEINDESLSTLKQQKVPEKVVVEMIRRQWEMSSARSKASKSSYSSEPKWEIEVHGGIPAGYHQSSASVAPPAAESYSLSGSGAQGDFTRRVSSWYFGDGARMIGLSSPLDPILGKPVIESRGPIYGMRVSRSLNSWIAAELSFDRSRGFAITSGGLAQIEWARVGFATFWSRINVPGNTPSASDSTLSRYSGPQSFATGAVVFSFPQVQQIKPFVTIGAGAVFTSGTAPSAALVGTYGGPSAQETDSVRLTYTQDRRRAIGPVVGGGAKIHISRHWGIRGDIRFHIYRNPFSTVLDANHTNTTDAAWIVGATDASGKQTPILQRLSGTGISSFTTLSGPALSGFRTNSTSGVQWQTLLTLGLFYRF